MKGTLSHCAQKLSNIAREIGKRLWKNAKRRGDKKRVALAEIVTTTLLMSRH